MWACHEPLGALAVLSTKTQSLFAPVVSEVVVAKRQQKSIEGSCHAGGKRGDALKQNKPKNSLQPAASAYFPSDHATDSGPFTRCAHLFNTLRGGAVSSPCKVPFSIRYPQLLNFSTEVVLAVLKLRPPCEHRAHTASNVEDLVALRLFCLLRRPVQKQVA